MKVFRCLIVAGVCALATGATGQTPSRIHEKDRERKSDAEDLHVFQHWIRWNNGGSLLLNHLTSEAFSHYATRDSAVRKLKTRKDWERRQQKVRETLRGIFGSFPEKTPLNATVTGIIDMDGYHVEKIFYESHPGFFVTGCLYVPARRQGKVPAVLNLIGHEQESFRAELDQVMATNLVKKGMVVLTIDPPGQGEHVQYFDPGINFSSIGYSVVEHCYFGNQCFLAGVNSAKYFVWDAIRAIDYLVSRREVDADRIGVTGFSGGGTITSFVGALDDRVKVAIPSSWSTANRRQLETKGAQDAEATLMQSVAKGITFEDLIEVRAPRPTMMTFTSRDEYLTLQGAREAFAEAAKAYAAFSAPDNLRLVEDDAKHWLTPAIRERIFGFFMEHFGIDGNPREEAVQILSPDQLKVTHTGQIATGPGGRMIFDVNAEEVKRYVARLENSRREDPSHLQQITERAKALSGFREPDRTESAFINGGYQRDGYTISKLAVPGEGDYAIPFLLFVPDDGRPSHHGIVYLHPEGKELEAQPGGEIERLVRAGNIVAAPDLPGIGELLNTASRELADGYTAVLIGRSVPGIQAGDAVRIVRYLKSRSDIDPASITGIARGNMGIPLLHAAAFDPSITAVALVGSLISYRAVAMNRFYRIGLIERPNGGHHHPYEIEFSWGVAGALTAYDLPDLLATLVPRKVVLAGPTDQMLQPASEALIREEMQFPKSVYASRNAASRIRIMSSKEDILRIATWLQE